jgi:long-chain fatty acid transport protein
LKSTAELSGLETLSSGQNQRKQQNQSKTTKMKTTNMESPMSFVRARAQTIVQAAARVAVTLALLSLAAQGYAEGFRNPPPGTFNLGRAGGRIAQIDDSSAVQQNPANLVEIARPEAQLTPTIVYIKADFTSTNGQKASTEEPWKLLPNLFGSMPLFDGKVALGLGVTTPYGIGSQWDEDSDAYAFPTGILRYQATHFAELQTINFNPAISVKIGDHLQLGAGFDAMWSQVKLKQFYPWFIFPGSVGTEPDGRAKAEGDGWGYGGNVGLTWRINERHRLAVTYRSPIDVDYDGDFKINNITPTAAFLGATPESDFGTKVGFPTIVAAGYGFQLTDSIRLEADFEWIEFSRFDSLNLSLGNNAFLLPSTQFRQNWKNTFTAGIGGDWKFAENWVLRASYQYYESPVPDSTFSPTIPDANQNVFTIGIGYKCGHHSLEAAYGLDFYDERHIRNDLNPAFNGDYEFTVHLFSAAYHFSF